MYPALLDTHSIIRFIILFTSVASILLAFVGWFGNKDYTKGNKVLNLLTLISAHIQLVIGLILYFISPNVLTQDMGSAMKDHVLRYWTVEHITMMIAAVVLITIGYSKSKKALTSVEKHRTIAVFYTLAVVIVIVAIVLSGRPLLGMSR